MNRSAWDDDIVSLDNNFQELSGAPIRGEYTGKELSAILSQRTFKQNQELESISWRQSSKFLKTHTNAAPTYHNLFGADSDELFVMDREDPELQQRRLIFAEKIGCRADRFSVSSPTNSLGEVSPAPSISSCSSYGEEAPLTPSSSCTSEDSQELVENNIQDVLAHINDYVEKGGAENEVELLDIDESPVAMRKLPAERKARRSSGKKKPRLYDFLMEVLDDSSKYGDQIHWLNKKDKTFKIIDSAFVARTWGCRKNKPSMKYENFARSLRTYVTKGVLVKPKNKLVYQFTGKPL